MKPKQITLILLFTLVAFVAGSWGKFLEWWADLSPGWKTFFCVLAWALAMLIGTRQGKTWGLVAIISGPFFAVVFTLIYIDRKIKDID